MLPVDFESKQKYIPNLTVDKIEENHNNLKTNHSRN